VDYEPALARRLGQIQALVEDSHHLYLVGGSRILARLGPDSDGRQRVRRWALVRKRGLVRAGLAVGKRIYGIRTDEKSPVIYETARKSVNQAHFFFNIPVQSIDTRKYSKFICETMYPYPLSSSGLPSPPGP
jgi:hypothetical protein